MKKGKLLSLIMTSAMALSLVVSSFVPANIAEAAEKTTVYYGFGTVSSFTPGETYMFLADEGNQNISEDSCLLGLPSGTGTVKATDQENDAKSIVEQFDPAQEQSWLQSELNHLLQDKGTWIADFQQIKDSDPEWWADRYGDKTVEEAYDYNVQDVQNKIASLQELENVQMTVSAYVDVVERGEGFDGCEKGALCNGGSFYFCDGGGVQGLAGKVFTYKTAEVGAEDLKAEIRSASVNKVNSELAQGNKVELAPDDVSVKVVIDGKEYEVYEFEFVDNIMNPATNDNEIEIKFGSSNAKITVTIPEANKAPSTVVGRDGGVDADTLKANNASKTVVDGSAAAKEGKTVNDVIDVLASTDTTAKLEMVQDAVNAGNLKVIVDNKDTNKITGSVNDVRLLLSALTGQELVDGITGNDNVVVTLEITEKDTSKISTALKDGINKMAGQAVSNNANIYYIDVDLFLEKNSQVKSAVTELGTNTIDVTLTIPAAVKNGGNVIKLIRTHDEANGTTTIDVLDDNDQDANTYTFTTSKLCTMAFAYANVDAQKVATAPKTGENVMIIFLYAAASMAALIGYAKKEKFI